MKNKVVVIFYGALFVILVASVGYRLYDDEQRKIIAAEQLQRKKEADAKSDAEFKERQAKNLRHWKESELKEAEDFIKEGKAYKAVPLLQPNAAAPDERRAALLVQAQKAARGDAIAAAKAALKTQEFGSILEVLHQFDNDDADGEIKRLAKAIGAVKGKWEGERQKFAEANPYVPSKPGVTLGMSKDQVLESSWGKPRDIYTTVTKTGVREQWAYGERSFLYFDNGVLTAIQK